MAFKNTLNYVDLKSTVTFTDINGLVQYVNLSAVDVILDAFSKDLFKSNVIFPIGRDFWATYWFVSRKGYFVKEDLLG